MDCNLIKNNTCFKGKSGPGSFLTKSKLSFIKTNNVDSFKDDMNDILY